MRPFIVGLFSAALAACGGGHNDVPCEQDSNCDLSGGGKCIAASTGHSWCAYPDPQCPSGYRFSTQDIGDGLSGTCVSTSSGSDAGVDAPPDANLPIADWATRYGGPGDDSGIAVAVAPNGDLVMTGAFTNTMNVGGAPLSSAGGTDIWVARYKADGTHLWSTKFGGIGADRGLGVAVDASGDVYVVGDFTGPVNFGGGNRTNSHGAFLVKLAGATGVYAWDNVSAAMYASGVTVVSASIVAIGGSFGGTVDFGGGNVTSTPSNGFDSFVAAYNISNGAHVWSKALTTTGADGEFGGLVAVAGDVIITAGYFGTASLGGAPFTSNSNSEDIFVVRLKGGDGSHVWSFGKGGAGADYPHSIASDGTHVFVGGEFLATTNLGGSDLTTAGSFDAFVASYNFSDGTHAWSQRYGGMNSDDTRSIAANTTRLSASIQFSGTMPIGTQNLTAAQQDIALARLNATTGAPSVAAQFGSPDNDTMAIVYTNDKLAGVGTFSSATDLFGTHLMSDGGKDIASFRVDF